MVRADYDPDFPSEKEMFQDMNLSRELVEEYRSKLPDHSEGRKLSVMVLQRSVWPFTVQQKSVDLPFKVAPPYLNKLRGLTRLTDATTIGRIHRIL